ncbi:hypothetical protein SYNPS1DRAFT_24105 [Syncephalis pseudoplumigaleata]|uniref:Uncharacterized protein n=1 Tax=Syncephalis pseudoplumigaleata TaxID=1712513 RepID=A0A4P9YVB1_9FUNG|nr:hypothetical protein SYNPS1DRAFT_24105 [Syncephalis pseudoplumigaleata]|eukprot:RKP23814.1 hypothetical protein SYNPS1DRAFT_24105 [Syncephalis pseudoplumigaleata]
MGTVRQLLAALVLVLAANASLGDAAAIRRTVSGPEHHHQHGHSAHIMNKRAVAATEAEAADAYGNAGRPVSGTQVSSNGFGFDAVGNLLGYASSTSNGHTDTSLNFADVLGNGGSAAILGFTQGLSADRSARGQPTLDAHQSAVGSGGNAIVNVLGVGDQSSRGHTSTASSFIDGVGVAGGSSALGATQHINVTPETSTGHSGPLYRRAEADYDAYGEYEASTPLYRRQLKGRPTRSKKLVVLKIPKVKLHRRSAYETKPRRKKVNVVFADDLFPKDEPSDTSAATAPDMMPDTAAPEATSSASEAAVPTTPEEDADLAEEGPMRRVSKLATPPARDARVVTATTTTNAVDGLGGVLVLNGDGHGGGESIDGIENAIGLSDLLGAGIGTKLLGGESKSTTLRYTRRALLDGLNVINGNGVDTDDVLGAGTKLDALSTRARSINGLPASKEAMEAVSQTSPDAPKAGDVESTSTKTFSLLSLDNNAGLLGDTLHTFQSDRAANADVNNLAGLIGDTDVLAHSITQTNHRDEAKAIGAHLCSGDWAARIAIGICRFRLGRGNGALVHDVRAMAMLMMVLGARHRAADCCGIA